MKRILFLLLIAVILLVGCKTSSETPEQPAESTLSITEVVASVDFAGGQGNKVEAEIIVIGEVDPIDHAGDTEYEYSFQIKYKASNTGSGVDLNGVNTTYYSNGSSVGNATWGSEAFAKTHLNVGESSTTHYLIVTTDEVINSVSVKINYSSGSTSKSVESSADFPTVPQPQNLPVINSFTADRTSIEEGESVMFSWDVSNANQVNILRGSTSIYTTTDLIGSTTITPSSSAFYYLKATNNDGDVSESIYVYVNVAKVEYVVSGVREASLITISGEGETTLQFSDVQLPWNYKMYNVSSGDFLYVSAQNDGKSGCIKVQIFKNGVLYKEAESCGAYVIATASGTY